MVEFRVANDEDGVEEYLLEWHEILQNNCKFYHLYVDGEKKDNTLYAFNVFDFIFDGEKMLMGLGTDKDVTFEKGYILCHKMVEDYYNEEVMKHSKSKDNKHLSNVAVLIDCNKGNILYESKTNEYNRYYDVLSKRLFAVSHNSVKTYYEIYEDGVREIFKGEEKMSTKTNVYGVPIIKERTMYYSAYILNKETLDLVIDL